MSEECIYCLISQGKIQSAKVYEDKEVIAFLDIRPATKGHLQVIPKKHAPLMKLLSPALRSKLFNTAVSVGSGLVNKLKASGVSYIINEGQGAEQRVPHASIQIIPRYDGDDVNISWKSEEMNQEEINNYLKKVIKALQQEEVEDVKPKSSVNKKVEEKIEEKEESEEEEEVVEIKERVPKYW